MPEIPDNCIPHAHTNARIDLRRKRKRGLQSFTGASTDRKLLFARPPVLSAARVRENWFFIARFSSAKHPLAVGMIAGYRTVFLPGLREKMKKITCA
jgi:hypothetical protein